MASRKGSSLRQPLGLPAPEDLAARIELVERDPAVIPRRTTTPATPHSMARTNPSAAPASMAAHFARLAELASMRATIAQEEAQNLADLARIADIHLAGSPQQSVTSTVPHPSPVSAPPAPEYLGQQAVATLLDCSPRTVRRMELEGELPPPVQLGGLKRWRRADLDALLQPSSAAKGGSRP